MSSFEYRKNLNTNVGECKWMALSGVRECNFNFETVIERATSKNDDVVLLPQGTKLYNATQILSNDWFRTRYPSNTENGGVWFTSTLDHAKNISYYTHILEYTTKEDLILLYIHNLKKYGDVKTRGYEFVRKHYRDIFFHIQETTGYKIQGYIGCNECEIFIENSQLPKTLEKIPTVAFQRSMKYID